MAHDRGTRVAARRAFINLKQTYLLAIAQMTGGTAQWLRRQIQAAEDPVDLWLLRAAVFEMLSATAFRDEREALQRGIDSMFPHSVPNSGFAAFV